MNGLDMLDYIPGKYRKSCDNVHCLAKKQKPTKPPTTRAIRDPNVAALRLHPKHQGRITLISTAEASRLSQETGPIK
jgi:hypothetical protein